MAISRFTASFYLIGLQHLHRKGIKSLVLEKYDTIRATGAAIGVFINAWRALDQLGVGAELRRKAVLVPEYAFVAFL